MLIEFLRWNWQLTFARLFNPFRAAQIVLSQSSIPLGSAHAGATPHRPGEVADDNLIPGDAILREFVGGSTIPIPHNE